MNFVHQKILIYSFKHEFKEPINQSELLLDKRLPDFERFCDESIQVFERLEISHNIRDPCVLDFLETPLFKEFKEIDKIKVLKFKIVMKFITFHNKVMQTISLLYSYAEAFKTETSKLQAHLNRLNLISNQYLLEIQRDDLNLRQFTKIDVKGFLQEIIEEINRTDNYKKITPDELLELSNSPNCTLCNTRKPAFNLCPCHHIKLCTVCMGIVNERCNNVAKCLCCCENTQGYEKIMNV